MKSFNIELRKGNKESRKFTVKNGGGGILTCFIDIETKSKKDWIKLPKSPCNFSVAHNCAQDIEFTIETHGLPFGFKDDGTIKITSNGGDGIVAIALEVERRKFSVFTKPLKIKPSAWAGVALGIANFFTPLPLPMSLFFVIGCSTKLSPKRWFFYLLVAFVCILLAGNWGIFTIAPIIGYIVGRVVPVPDKITKGSVVSTLIGACVYLFFKLVRESQLYDLTSLDLIFSDDLVMFLFPQVLIASTITSICFISIYFVIRWLCGLISRMAGRSSVFLSKLVAQNKLKHLALLIVIPCFYFVEPYFHYQIRHPFNVHHPLCIPIVICAVMAGYVLNSFTVFQNMFWRTSFTSKVGLGSLYFFFYHFTFEMFESLGSWGLFSEIQYGEIITITGILSLPIGAMMNHLVRELK